MYWLFFDELMEKLFRRSSQLRTKLVQNRIMMLFHFNCLIHCIVVVVIVASLLNAGEARSFFHAERSFNIDIIVYRNGGNNTKCDSKGVNIQVNTVVGMYIDCFLLRNLDLYLCLCLM
jgi:hypothetical protein